MGHIIIYITSNCEIETSWLEELGIVIGFVLFGTGIAGYYSLSMPGVGLAVPVEIRGTAFAYLGFFQALAMTAVPLISGYIIEEDSSNYMQGYRDSSVLFVWLCVAASALSLVIWIKAKPDSFRFVQGELSGNSEPVNKDTENPNLIVMA
jgi:MFS family permease